MADLITLAEVKTALGVTNNSQDAKITQAIPEASTAIRNYVDRDFETPVSASADRTYYYDGSGVLEIDDAQTVTAVTLDGVPLTPDEFSAEPASNGPFSWIFLPERKWSINPQMGFTRNLDNLWWRATGKPQVVVVTGTWGWPTVPEDVKRAAIWTTINFMENPRPVTTESIGGVSRSYTTYAHAIPQRARELLEPYFRGRQ